MKKHIYLLSVVILAFTMLVSAPAKAAPVSKDGTHLPINSNIVLLTIAGLVIGIAAVKKSKPAKIAA